MSDFKVKHASVTPAYAARLADELEAMIGEVMNGRRKADRLPVEHMFGLIQFARATPAPTGPAPAVEGVDPATLPTPENTALLLGLIAAVQGWADGKLVMGAAVEDLIAHIDAFGAQQREEGRRDMHETNVTLVNDICKLSEKLGAMRSAFHINMLRAHPGKSHEEIGAEIDRAIGAAPTAQEVTEPSRAKLRPMQSEEEQAAGIVRQWYFDCDGHYIDVALDDGKYSIFFRDRATKKGAWMDQSDEVVTPPTATAAPAPQEFTSNPVNPQKGESLSDKVAPPAQQQAGIAAQGAQADLSRLPRFKHISGKICERGDGEFVRFDDVEVMFPDDPAQIRQSQTVDEWGVESGWVTYTIKGIEKLKREPDGYGYSTKYRVIPRIAGRPTNSGGK